MAQAAMVLSKARAALVSYLQSANVGTSNIYDEKSSGDKAAPNVSCGAHDAAEDPDIPGSGNFYLMLEVRIKYLAAVDTDGTDPRPLSQALTTAVFNALEVSDLAAQLSAATVDFAVQGILDGETDEDVDGDCWVDVWRRRIYCCASAL